jgi:hypothetical protein
MLSLSLSTEINEKTCLMGYGLKGRGSIPGRGKVFLFSIASRPALGPTQPPIQWVLWALSPGVKWPGHEADHSPSSAAQVKNGGPIPSPYHMSSWHSALLSTGTILLFFKQFSYN